MSSPSPVNPPQSRSTHLLIVDDDAEISALVSRYFSAQGFRVSVAGDGSTMRQVLAVETVDLVLLDLGLPGEDGFELTRHLHQHWRGPVIIITGRGEAVDRVVGLELGADDYVTKPFDLRELLARIRSVLRRAVKPAAAEIDSNPEDRPFRFAGYSFALQSRTLTDPQGNDVPLTTGEYDLLRVFVEQPNRVLSRDTLMTRIHSRDAGPFDRAIDVQIGRLRRKIEADPASPALIKAIRGVGYLFTGQVTRE